MTSSENILTNQIHADTRGGRGENEDNELGHREEKGFLCGAALLVGVSITFSST